MIILIMIAHPYLTLWGWTLWKMAEFCHFFIWRRAPKKMETIIYWHITVKINAFCSKIYARLEFQIKIIYFDLTRFLLKDGTFSRWCSLKQFRSLFKHKCTLHSMQSICDFLYNVVPWDVSLQKWQIFGLLWYSGKW